MKRRSFIATTLAAALAPPATSAEDSVTAPRPPVASGESETRIYTARMIWPRLLVGAPVVIGDGRRLLIRFEQRRSHQTLEKIREVSTTRRFFRKPPPESLFLTQDLESSGPLFRLREHSVLNDSFGIRCNTSCDPRGLCVQTFSAQASSPVSASRYLELIGTEQRYASFVECNEDGSQTLREYHVTLR